MKTGRMLRGSIGLLAFVLIAGACGGSDSKKASTPAAGATSAATKPAAGATVAATKAPGAVATARTDVDELKVIAKDFSFTLDLTSVRPGAPGVDVRFANQGATTHTLAFYKDADFKTKIGESNPVAAGSSVAFPFVPPSGATSVFYRCEIHPGQMKGELAVK